MNDFNAVNVKSVVKDERVKTYDFSTVYFSNEAKF